MHMQSPHIRLLACADDGNRCPVIHCSLFYRARHGVLYTSVPHSEIRSPQVKSEGAEHVHLCDMQVDLALMRVLNRKVCRIVLGAVEQYAVMRT